MHRLLPLLLFACANGLGTADAVSAAHPEVQQLPNVVLMMGDDHGWEETGYNGHPYVKTPVLDRMAAEGLRLDNFYAGHPTCSPTRGSFLTGRHPNRYGTFTPNYSMRPEELTIGHVMKAVGYRTAHFGKWHVGPVNESSPTSPGAMGFDEWLSHDNFFELDPVLSPSGLPPQKYPGESSQVIVDAAIDFIKNCQAADTPYFVVIWFGSPHEPYSGLPGDLALYDDLPDELADRKVRLTSNETGRPTTRPQRDVLRERYAEITAMDRAIGTLQSHLEQTGDHSSTLQLYCGDNGTPTEAVAASPLRGKKGNLYEGGIRVPGVIVWPDRIKEPRTSTYTASTSDLLPTLCALTGQQPKHPLDGIDLAAVIDDRAKARPEPLYFWMYDVSQEVSGSPAPYIEPELQTGTTPLVKLMGGIATRNFTNYVHPKVENDDYQGSLAVIDGPFKLLARVRPGKKPEFELYNLDADRAEEENLAGGDPQTVDRLYTQMRHWQTSVLESLTGADYDKP